MQRLGQHFLKNKNVAVKISDTLALRVGDTIFEIGPGHGELTEQLKLSTGGGSAMGGKIKNMKIVSIEKDGGLCGVLKKRFKGDEEIEIICGDALTQLPLLIQKYQNIKTSKYKLVGNIPYYITGHLLRIISELKNKPERAVFMVQKEVAERIVAQPPKMNRLAASVQFWAEPKIIATVLRNDFRPAPDVDSAIIFLFKKDAPAPCNTDDYYAAVRVIFSQPRKTVLNNILNGIDMKKGGNHAKEKIVAILENIGIDPKYRPQNLSVQNIMAITKAFFEK